MTPAKHIYGPVRSARLGLSLGLDLVPHKTCCYDCIYCQQGPTTNKTFELAEYVPAERVLQQLRSFIREYSGKLDVITLSGSGEPCLNASLGKVIRGVKDLNMAPVCVLTNGAPMLYDSVREALLDADIVIPTLTSPRKRTFRPIHRPVEGILPDALISAWIEFKKRYRGRFVVEVMVLAGVNDSDVEVEALRGALQVIEPDEVQMNTVRRPPQEERAKPVTQKRLKEIGRRLGLPFSLPALRRRGAAGGEFAERMVEILRRRPCTAAEIADALGVATNQALKTLEDLRAQNRISIKRLDGRPFYFVEETP